MARSESSRIPGTNPAPFARSEATEGMEIGTTPGGASQPISLNLTIEDPDVLAELARIEPDQRERFALAALRVGVLAMRQARGSIDVAAVRDEGRLLLEQINAAVTAHQKDLENRLGHTLERYLDPKQGLFSQRAEKVFGENGELVNKLREHVSGDDSRMAKLLVGQIGENSPFLKHFDPQAKQSVIARIETAVEHLLEEQKRVVLDEFDLNKEESAINRLLKGVRDLNANVTGEFSLDNDQSALSRLAKLLNDTKEQIHKDLDLNNEQSALARLNEQLQLKVKALQEEQTKFQAQVNETLSVAFARKAEREQGTRHGEDFEEDALRAVRELAQHPGDDFEAVGTSVGAVRNSKVGDAVLILGEESAVPGARIVYEFKQDASYDQRRAFEELEIACTNREASVGVFVMSKRIALDGTKSASWERPLVRRGNHILVTWHPDDESCEPFLYAAVSLARALVMREQAEAESEVDWGVVDAQLDEIESQVGRFEAIEGATQKIRKSANDIDDELRKLGKRLRKAAERLAEQVNALRSGE